MGQCMRFITSNNPTNYTSIKLMELIQFFFNYALFFLIISGKICIGQRTYYVLNSLSFPSLYCKRI